MDSLADRLAAFRAVPRDERGEASEKCKIVEQMEGHLAAPEVLGFFLELIGDTSEYDLARIDALKILGLWEAPDLQTRHRIGLRLAEVLRSEEDVLVQQWAGIAAEWYADIPEVFTAVSAVLTDQGADLDVRHNCLAAVKRLGDSEVAVNVLRLLEEDGQLGDHVRGILRAMGL
jgi:hypothetical protein